MNCRVIRVDELCNEEIKWYMGIERGIKLHSWENDNMVPIHDEDCSKPMDNENNKTDTQGKEKARKTEKILVAAHGPSDGRERTDRWRMREQRTMETMVREDNCRNPSETNDSLPCSHTNSPCLLFIVDLYKYDKNYLLCFLWEWQHDIFVCGAYPTISAWV